MVQSGTRGGPGTQHQHDTGHMLGVFGTVAEVAAELSLAAAKTAWRPTLPARGARKRAAENTWYATIATGCAVQLDHIIVALRRPVEHIEPDWIIARDRAFSRLADLVIITPELHRLFAINREYAISELAEQLTTVRQQIEAGVRIVECVADQVQAEESEFVAARDALLEQAGGALLLTQAANELGISRQAAHKRISANTMLGMMRDGKIVVPVIQLTSEGAAAGKKVVLPGIGQVSALFSESGAGPWSALQFLVEHDPNIKGPPIEALKRGEVDRVVTAARAYLSCDEV